MPLTAFTCHQFSFGFSFHENNKFDIVKGKMKEDSAKQLLQEQCYFQFRSTKYWYMTRSICASKCFISRRMARPSMSSATPTRHTDRSQVNVIAQRVVFSPSNILVGHMVVTSALGKVRMHKQNIKTAVPLDGVPERRTKRFPPRFRPVGRFCELRFRYLSSPTGREGEISRHLDHMRQIPFIHSARFIDSTNLYIYRTVF